MPLKYSKHDLLLSIQNYYQGNNTKKKISLTNIGKFEYNYNINIIIQNIILARSYLIINSMKKNLIIY